MPVSVKHVSSMEIYCQIVSTSCLIIPFINRCRVFAKYCSPLKDKCVLQVVRHDGPSGSSQRPIVLDDTASSDVEISDDDYQGGNIEV